MQDSINVIKIDGSNEPFSESKIRSSASRVGVPEDLQDELLAHIKSKLHNNIRTTEIFAEIKNFLKDHDQSKLSTMFNLKSAILELGPSGYPFEKYIAKLLEAYHYRAETNQTLQGKCITHEIDVVATKDNKTSIIEAKFHSKQSVKTDVKVVLYIKSRFEDVADGWKGSAEVLPWIITNARFTSDAISYGECTNIRLTSWDYPSRDSLRTMIESVDLHPVTILDTASQKNKNLLLSNGIVTCRQLHENKKQISNYISSDDLKTMLQEAEQVCSVN